MSGLVATPNLPNFAVSTLLESIWEEALVPCYTREALGGRCQLSRRFVGFKQTSAEAPLHSASTDQPTCTGQPTRCAVVVKGQVEGAHVTPTWLKWQAAHGSTICAFLDVFGLLILLRVRNHGLIQDLMWDMPGRVQMRVCWLKTLKGPRVKESNHPKDSSEANVGRLLVSWVLIFFQPQSGVRRQGESNWAVNQPSACPGKA